MRRDLPRMLLALAVAMLMVMAIGCKQGHPVKVTVDDAMKKGTVEQIAVFPFASSIHQSDDPDEIAPTTMNRLFRAELDTRSDYKFLSPESVDYALHGMGLEESAKEFISLWRTKKQVDREFLTSMSEAVQADALLIGVVDLWQKDEVDYRETSTPATYVGATISIIRMSDGKVLFEAIDEDFLEGALSEAGDRGARTGALGNVRVDRAANMYQAPEYEEVAVKVARALVSSIPTR